MSNKEQVWARIKLPANIGTDLLNLDNACNTSNMQEIPAWIYALAPEADNTDKFIESAFSTKTLGFTVLSVDNSNDVVIADDEGYFNADNATFILQAAFKHYNHDGYACLNVSYAGSDILTNGEDMLGGCAYFVTKDSVKYMATGEWLGEQIAAHESQPEKSLAELFTDACKHVLKIAPSQEVAAHHIAKIASEWEQALTANDRVAEHKSCMNAAAEKLACCTEKLQQYTTKQAGDL